MFLINRATINDILIKRFPELKSFFEEQFNFWGEEDIPPHCFYGDVLNGYVTELLREGNDEEQIKKVFSYYEEMADCNDDYVKNLLQVTLLEYLWDEKTVFDRAHKYMQPKTREINNNIKDFLNEPT